MALLLPVAVHAAPALAQDDGPTVLLRPNPVATGDEVEVLGRGYCARASCSPVTVSVERTVVASGVKVGDDGSFTARFVVESFSGQYPVTASQADAQSTISATTQLLVANRDTQLSGSLPTTRPATTTQTAAVTPPTRPTSTSRPTPPSPSSSPATTTRPAATATPGPTTPGGIDVGSTVDTRLALRSQTEDQASRDAAGWLAVAAGVVVVSGGLALLWRRLRRRRAPG